MVELFPDGRNQIDHVKLLMVDSQVAIFGGMNWGRGSYRNHDFDVVVTGPAVAHLENVFVADLVRCGRATDQPPAAEPDPPGLRLLTTYPNPEIRPEVVQALATAQRFVFVEMYVLTDSETLAALGAAGRRGVATWVLLDPNQDLNQAAAARLRDAGVQTRFYRTSGEKLHAKAMVVDGATLVVGSANWTSSGFTRNHELDAVIRSPAPGGAGPGPDGAGLGSAGQEQRAESPKPDRRPGRRCQGADEHVRERTCRCVTERAQEATPSSAARADETARHFRPAS